MIICNVRILLAEHNVVRARQGLGPISVRELARLTGISHSSVVQLINGESRRVDFQTIEKLMAFFNTMDMNDILRRVPGDSTESE